MTLLCVCVVLVSCAVQRTPPIRKLVLLSSFEGRCRDVGHEALYAVQLALKEAGDVTLHLVAADDGGSVSSAVQRAQALARDPAVVAVLAAGTTSTDERVQAALPETPLLLVGHWGTAPAPHALMLASRAAQDSFTLPPDFTLTDAPTLRVPVVGGEILAQAQLPALRPSMEGITILSSAALPDADFEQRYRAMGLYAPAPSLLATLAYDAARTAIESVRTGVPLADITYPGLNGQIRFREGYWQDAPVRRYSYADGRLMLQGGPGVNSPR